MLKAHERRKGLATLGVCRREARIEFGVIHMSEDQKFSDYIEKPSFSHYMSMGVNVFNRRVQKLIRPDESIGIPDLIKRAQAAGEAIHCHLHEGEWLDIGRIEDFQKAQDLFESRPKAFLV
jgi:mannose-1-phosphate guanylyltransferase